MKRNPLWDAQAKQHIASGAVGPMLPNALAHQAIPGVGRGPALDAGMLVGNAGGNRAALQSALEQRKRAALAAKEEQIRQAYAGAAPQPLPQPIEEPVMPPPEAVGPPQPMPDFGGTVGPSGPLMPKPMGPEGPYRQRPVDPRVRPMPVRPAPVDPRARVMNPRTPFQYRVQRGGV